MVVTGPASTERLHGKEWTSVGYNMPPEKDRDGRRQQNQSAIKTLVDVTYVALDPPLLRAIVTNGEIINNLSRARVIPSITSPDNPDRSVDSKRIVEMIVQVAVHQFEVTESGDIIALGVDRLTGSQVCTLENLEGLRFFASADKLQEGLRRAWVQVLEIKQNVVVVARHEQMFWRKQQASIVISMVCRHGTTTLRMKESMAVGAHKQRKEAATCVGDHLHSIL